MLIHLDVSKMPGTFCNVFRARLALEVSVDRSKTSIGQSANLGSLRAFFKRLWVLYLCYTETFYLIRRENAELNRLHSSERRR